MNHSNLLLFAQHQIWKLPHFSSSCYKSSSLICTLSWRPFLQQIHAFELEIEHEWNISSPAFWAPRSNWTFCYVAPRKKGGKGALTFEWTLSHVREQSCEGRKWSSSSLFSLFLFLRVVYESWGQCYKEGLSIKATGKPGQGWVGSLDMLWEISEPRRICLQLTGESEKRGSLG